MSSKGRTWTNEHRQTPHQKFNSRRKQRNRHMDDLMARQLGVGGMSYEELQHHVRKCKSKCPHKSAGAAYRAKLQAERDYGVEHFVYECPICGKFHTTTHPWPKFEDMK